MRVWCNGSVLPIERASVSVLDHGLTVGDGVFETLKVVRGIPFAATRHIARLRRSAAALGLPAPDAEVVREAMAAAVDANREEVGELGRLRVTYTSGPGPLGSERGDGPRTLVAIALPARPWPPTTTAVTLDWPRNERSPLAGVKSTSYAESAAGLAQARAGGASEGIWGNTAGYLSEGTGSNVFLFDGDRLVTPGLDSGCLPGVTRALVCEWFGAAQERVPFDGLARAAEVLLTSSTRDVHPVALLDGRRLPTDRGERLARAFAERAADDPDP